MHAGASPRRRADWLHRSAGVSRHMDLAAQHPHGPAQYIFHAKANNSNLEAQYFSCSASELLTVAPVLNLCFATIVAAQGYCTACVTSLCACLDVVELLVTMKNATVPPALLRDAVTRHVTSRRAAYGPDIDANAMKLHMTQHLAGMLEDVGALYSCWVQERHHRLLTKYAGQRKNTASYERGVMHNITVEQCQTLEAASASAPQAVSASSRHARRGRPRYEY